MRTIKVLILRKEAETMDLLFHKTNQAESGSVTQESIFWLFVIDSGAFQERLSRVI